MGSLALEQGINIQKNLVVVENGVLKALDTLLRQQMKALTDQNNHNTFDLKMISQILFCFGNISGTSEYFSGLVVSHTCVL